MKPLDFSHWENSEHIKKLKFFVETLIESLFNYSFESYRVPSLNAHLLCYDVYKTAEDILKANIDKLHAVAGVLLKKEKIDGEEFDSIFA